MTNVFIYATLKKAGIRKEALKGKVVVPRRATLKGWRELHTSIDGTDWPHAERHPGETLGGELVNVTAAELKELDNWENKYGRKQVETSGGPAWIYVLKELRRPKNEAPKRR